MKSDKPALAALLAVTMIWGVDYVAVDYISEYFSETFISLMKVGIAAILVTGVELVKDKGLHIENNDWLRTILCGIFGMGIYVVMETYGISHTSGAMTSIIMATTPVMGLLADRVFYGIRITVKNAIGILGSVAGVILCTRESFEGNSAKGIIILIIAMVIWVLYIVFSKPLYEKYSLTTVLSGVLSSGTLITIPLLFIIDRPIIVTSEPLPVLILILTSVCTIFAAQLLYSFAISRTSVTIVSLSENVTPLITILFSWIIFGKMLTPYEIAGGTIIIASVMLITMVKNKSKSN